MGDQPTRPWTCLRAFGDRVAWVSAPDRGSRMPETERWRGRLGTSSSGSTPTTSFCPAPSQQPRPLLPRTPISHSRTAISTSSTVPARSCGDTGRVNTRGRASTPAGATSSPAHCSSGERHSRKLAATMPHFSHAWTLTSCSELMRPVGSATLGRRSANSGCTTPASHPRSDWSSSAKVPRTAPPMPDDRRVVAHRDLGNCFALPASRRWRR